MLQRRGYELESEGETSRIEGFTSRGEGETSRAEGGTLRSEGFESRVEGETLRTEGFESREEGETSRTEGFESRLWGSRVTSQFGAVFASLRARRTNITRFEDTATTTERRALRGGLRDRRACCAKGRTPRARATSIER